jgi:hypothetical protein
VALEKPCKERQGIVIGQLKDSHDLKRKFCNFEDIGCSRPKVFALTLMPGPNDVEDEATHVQLWRFVLGHVACVYGGERAPEAATALWAFLHGMTALESAGVFGERKPASSFEFGLRMWIRAASKP